MGEGCIAADRDRLRQAAACHQAGTLGSGTSFGPEASGLLPSFTNVNPGELIIFWTVEGVSINS
jgi:hypothetical protein